MGGWDTTMGDRGVGMRTSQCKLLSKLTWGTTVQSEPPSCKGQISSFHNFRKINYKMSRKTVKDLNKDLIKLREDFKELETKFKRLAEKCETLEQKHKDCMSKVKTNFKCNVCDRECKSKAEFMKHKKSHKSVLPGKLKCEECHRVFDEMWKLEAHSKTHKKYECDKCDKIFSYEDTLNKHIQISHGNVKLFCHYFNNEKECPFEEECVFLHEHSDMCKYGELCERENCMYKHGDKSDDTEEINDKEDENEEEDEEGDVDVDEPNTTFISPFQSRESLSEDYRCTSCYLEMECSDHCLTTT